MKGKQKMDDTYQATQFYHMSLTLQHHMSLTLQHHMSLTLQHHVLPPPRACKFTGTVAGGKR